MTAKLRQALENVPLDWRIDFIKNYWNHGSLCPRCLILINDRRWYGSKHFYLKCKLPNPYKEALKLKRSNQDVP